MSKTAVVLLSGGQDSCTTLFAALHSGSYDRVLPVCLAYGQRHLAEVVAASEVAAIARRIGVTLTPPVDVLEPKRISLDLGQVVVSDLVPVQVPDPVTGLPTVDLAEPDGGLFQPDPATGLPRSWVPGRNALLLTLAAAVAWGVQAHHIWAGVCQADFSGYPDCRARFVKAMEAALTLGIGQTMRDGVPVPWEIVVETPLMYLTKREEVDLAARLLGCMEALARTVTCYRGERPGCGTCPACRLRARGFAEAEIPDPAIPVPAEVAPASGT
jgi:7-cyano-7-deazaguanine synthase